MQVEKITWEQIFTPLRVITRQMEVCLCMCVCVHVCVHACASVLGWCLGA